MNLHHAHKIPDWEQVPANRRNRWQRLAARSRGILTPANALSVAGAAVSLAGIAMALAGSVLVGAVLIAAGRLMDIFDGIVADYTGTKSPFGKTVDAGLDKLVTFTALIALVGGGLLPLWVAITFAVLNIINAVVTVMVERRGSILQPSSAGKRAMFGYWLSTILFIVTALPQPVFSWLRAPAIAMALVSAVLGTITAAGYSTTAKRKLLERHTRPPFDRYIVIYNPATTEAYKAKLRINELRDFQPDATIVQVETRPGGRAANRHLIKSLRGIPGTRTLLCIAAGDGTANMVLNVLLHGPRLPAEARQVPLLPMWCGNANDLAHMLNGHPARTSLEQLLCKGRIVPIRPLACILRLPGTSARLHSAASYASFGASAYATEEMERTLRKSPMRRWGGTRFGQEAVAVIRALIEAPTFTIRQDGHTNEIFERTYFNGSRFAKVIGAPLKLTDKAFHMAMIEHKHPLAVLVHLLGLAEGREGARITMTHDAFTVEDPVWAQFDGEATRIPKGTEVDISVGDQPFYALSTRLK